MSRCAAATASSPARVSPLLRASAVVKRSSKLSTGRSVASRSRSTNRSVSSPARPARRAASPEGRRRCARRPRLARARAARASPASDAARSTTRAAGRPCRSGRTRPRRSARSRSRGRDLHRRAILVRGNDGHAQTSCAWPCGGCVREPEGSFTASKKGARGGNMVSPAGAGRRHATPTPPCPRPRRRSRPGRRPWGRSGRRRERAPARRGRCCRSPRGRRPAPRGDAPDLGQGLEPVHHGHREVEQDDVRLEALRSRRLPRGRSRPRSRPRCPRARERSGRALGSAGSRRRARTRVTPGPPGLAAGARRAAERSPPRRRRAGRSRPYAPRRARS